MESLFRMPCKMYVSSFPISSLRQHAHRWSNNKMDNQRSLSCMTNEHPMLGIPLLHKLDSRLGSVLCVQFSLFCPIKSALRAGTKYPLEKYTFCPCGQAIGLFWCSEQTRGEIICSKRPSSTEAILPLQNMSDLFSSYDLFTRFHEQGTCRLHKDRKLQTSPYQVTVSVKSPHSMKS